jgi:hypothetical protein
LPNYVSDLCICDWFPSFNNSYLQPIIQITTQEYLKEEQTISIKAHENNIRRFIEYKIGGPNNIKSQAMDERLKKNIFEKVIDSAKGMLVIIYPVLPSALTIVDTTPISRTISCRFRHPWTPV